MTLKKFFITKQQFPISKKYQKNTVLSKYNSYHTVTKYTEQKLQVGHSLFTKDTQLSKLLEISKIKNIIYRPDTCNLQTKILLFRIMKNHSNKKMEVRLAFFINYNIKIPQVEQCLCLKYVMIYRSDLYNLRIRIKSSKGN